MKKITFPRSKSGEWSRDYEIRRGKELVGRIIFRPGPQPWVVHDLKENVGAFYYLDSARAEARRIFGEEASHAWRRDR